ncbi:MAG: gamma carbonic anhydrase family protein [Proteobacteria bacterium]|nr:gamma carbonic anhydrase family protein [Pseudomonadota bacterium]
MQTYGPDVTLINPTFIDPTSQIFGKVTVRERASIWPNVVIRAENFEVDIGPDSNVQDFTMVHVGIASGTHIGAHCSITHHCTIHGARIGDNCLIGINATLMDGVVVGNNCTVAGGTFIPENTVIPDNSVVMGVPGKVVRTENRWITNRINAWYYSRNAQAYALGNHREWSTDDFQRAVGVEHERLKREFEARQKSLPTEDQASL